MPTQTTRPAGAVASTGQSPSDVATPTAWAIGFLHGIGAPITQNNIQNVLAWGTGESGDPGTSQGAGGWTNFNPLNIVQVPGDRSTGAGGTQGNIANFGSLTDGVAASVRLFMQNSNAYPIIQTLRANGTRTQLSQAVNNFYSGWGGHINIPGGNIGGGATHLGGDVGGTIPQDSGSGSNWFKDIIGGAEAGVLGPFALIPGLGNIVKAGKAGFALEGAILGLFTNWRMVVQFFAGLALMGVGLLLILHDTGAGKAAVAGGQRVATVAAVAA